MRRAGLRHFPILDVRNAFASVFGALWRHASVSRCFTTAGFAFARVTRNPLTLPPPEELLDECRRGRGRERGLACRLIDEQMQMRLFGPYRREDFSAHAKRREMEVRLFGRFGQRQRIVTSVGQFHELNCVHGSEVTRVRS